jgi:hypothetical protein
MGALASEAEPRTWARSVGRVGTLARGLVFPVIGLSLLTAAVRQNPREARGFGQALADLASTPYGHFWLAFVAAGLFAYGFYMFVAALYAEIPSVDASKDRSVLINAQKRVG